MPLFVGIGGPSGAGKTTLAACIAARLPGQVARLPLDSYYVDLGDMPPEERAAYNFDHPDAIDWERFFEDFMMLEGGSAIDAPRYDFSLHARLNGGCRVEPLPIVLVEGLHVLWQPALRAMLNFRIYVRASQSVCLKRRIERDTAERGRQPGEVIRQYKQHTNPMFLEFVEPSIGAADLIIDGEQDFAAEVEKLAQRLT